MLRLEKQHRRQYAWVRCKHTWLRWCVRCLAVASLLTSAMANAAEPVQTFMLGDTAIRVPARWFGPVVSYRRDEELMGSRESAGIALRPRWMSFTFLDQNREAVRPLDASSLPWQVWLFPPQKSGGKTIEEAIGEAKAVAGEARRIQPDNDGFVLLPSKMLDYRPQWVLVGSEADHPSGAPFIVWCPDRAPATEIFSLCRSSFFWSHDIGLMFDFDLRLFPKNRWPEMHRGLTELLTYLTKVQ